MDAPPVRKTNFRLLALYVVVVATVVVAVSLLTRHAEPGTGARRSLVADFGLSEEASECIVREADDLGLEPSKLDDALSGDGSFPSLSDADEAMLLEATESCADELGPPVSTPTLITLPAGPDPTRP